jgi:hypothetical protein
MSVKAMVLEKFGEPQRCYGHCDQPAGMKVLGDNGGVVVAIACARGYVSRVVAYGPGDNASVLKSMVGDALGPGGDLRDEDVRTATRYAWDLGVEGKASGIVFKAAYWTQNYRRTKSRDADRKGLFACGKCSALFTQPVSSSGTLCPACSDS